MHRSRLFWIGLLALALHACGDDTSKSNAVNSGTSDMTSTPDMGETADDGSNNGGEDTGGGGDDMGGGGDDMGGDMGPDPRLCGNAELDPGEECDDANQDDTDECNSDCTLTCGDGVVGPAEQCDTAIADGMAGACPTACDDGMACTTDALQGSECQAQCVTGDITACSDGDGCCPSTCDATTDDDCAAICGNGVVEGTELCDGNCPTAADCDDSMACTADSLGGDASNCDAVCVNDAITTCVDGDGCCPSICDATMDDDCSATCGNNTIESPELCDGNCPMDAADCDDNDVCTADIVSGNPAQCNAVCVNAMLGCIANTMDGCCPAGCDATTDGDCTGICGNSAVEPGEQCDDGNTMDGDGCDSGCQLELGSGVAFRMSDLDLMDPHIHLQFFGCRDITNGNVPFNAAPPINGLLENAITLDEDGDGDLDLSFVAVFNPLDQSNGGTGNITVAEADCTAPMSSTSCTIDSMGSTFQTGTYTSDTMNDCLDAIMGTTSNYTPAIQASEPPCFASTTIDLTIDVSGILIPLTDVQIGGTWVGNPATGIANGLLRGFISEADADNIIIPSDIALVGGDPLSSLLPGGTGSCASGDDRDIGPDGLTMGWWFYLNFPADEVSFTIN